MNDNVSWTHSKIHRLDFHHVFSITTLLRVVLRRQLHRHLHLQFALGEVRAALAHHLRSRLPEDVGPAPSNVSINTAGCLLNVRRERPSLVEADALRKRPFQLRGVLGYVERLRYAYERMERERICLLLPLA